MQEELEVIQLEESQEGGDAAEAIESTDTGEVVEEQALDDATHEPGARVEEEQSFEQAETVEAELSDAMASVEQVEVPAPEEDSPPESDTDPGDLPEGSAVLVVPHETDEMVDPPEKPGPADVAEVPEGIEFQVAEKEDDPLEAESFYIDEVDGSVAEDLGDDNIANSVGPGAPPPRLDSSVGLSPGVEVDVAEELDPG